MEANRSLVDVQQAALRNNAAVAASLASIMTSIAAHHDAVVSHQVQFASAKRAASANRVARSVNAEVCSAYALSLKAGGSKAVMERELCPLLKEFFAAGDLTSGGVALADSLVPGPDCAQWQAWPPLATPEIGSAPDHFPKTPADIEDMAHVDLLRLVAFYNESFAIRQSDSLPERRDKFRRWCC